MANFWDDLKTKFKKGVETVSDRTDEYAKIGKVKVDIAGIKHNIHKLHADLGERVHELSKKKDLNTVAKDKNVVDLLERINVQETKLQQDESEIERIRKEKEEERKKRGAEPEKTKEAPVKKEKPKEAVPKAAAKPKAKKTTKSTKAKPAARSAAKTKD